MIPILVLLQLAAASADIQYQYGLSDIDTLRAATTHVDQRTHELIVELPSVAVPPSSMILTPVFRWTVPVDVCLYGFAVDMLDDVGRAVPPDWLHHVVLTDPNRRELFLPLPLPIFAASKESARPVLPKHLIGVPLPTGTRYIVAATFANPDTLTRQVRLRIRLRFVRPGLILPLFRAYPWVIDVTYPLGGEGGRHDFDLPPGRSSRSWVGSPEIPGTIVGMSGHAHDYATRIELVDVTSGDTIWHRAPIVDDAGRVLEIRPERFYRWYRLGVHIEPSHKYRVAVFYDNPTGRTIPFGGMGSVMGLFVPDRGTRWPSVDPRDFIYRSRLHDLLNNMAGVEMVEDAHSISDGRPTHRSTPTG